MKCVVFKSRNDNNFRACAIVLIDQSRACGVPGGGGGKTPENFGLGGKRKMIPFLRPGPEKWHPIQGIQTTANAPVRVKHKSL